MTGRVVAACAPLWLLVAGCFEEQQSRLVSPGATAEPTFAQSLNHVSRAPATEELARPVLAVGQKIVAANPQLGMRPVFLPVGAPHPEIFHHGTGGIDICQVLITEGLIRRCTTEAQLAAVLCHELGKAVAEREAQAGRDQRVADARLPLEAPLGNDAGGTFGPSDGTRRMEEGKREKQRRQQAALPDPEALARQYLVRAGFTAADLEQARPLLREAEDHCSIEKGWSATAGSPVPPPPPAPPAPRKRDALPSGL
jgi:hypothetical protein